MSLTASSCVIRIWRKERHSDSDVHFLSHFYIALPKGGPKAVTSWTAKKNVDIFTKKFIHIPINQSLHWSLCIVVNPGAILNEIDDPDREIADNSLLPCILFFDSLKAHQKNTITKHVRTWLNSEWKRLKKVRSQSKEDPFDVNMMKVYAPRGALPCLFLNVSFLHTLRLLLLPLSLYFSSVPGQQLGLRRICVPVRVCDRLAFTSRS